MPPSPPKLPIIGHLHLIGDLPHRSVRALSEKYGPLMMLQLGTVPTLVVSSVETAREIMKTHDIICSDRFQTRASNSIYLGSTDVAFATYGEYWRQVKKICVLELLTVKKVQSFHMVREEEVCELVEKIRQSSKTGASVNLSELLVGISNNIVSKAVLGRKLEGGTGKDSIGELTRRAMELFGVFSFQDVFPILGWLDVLTGLTSNLKRTSKKLHDFLGQVIEDHKNSKSNSDKMDFVDILLKHQRDNDLPVVLSDDNVKAVLLDMIVGGTDTTAATLEWAMAELVKNPNMMKKARDEVKRVVGKKGKVDEADCNQMKYIQCIIKETLRIYAVSPFLAPRKNTASIKLGGYDIPQNTRIFVAAWAIQRDSKVWDKPEVFLPERFLSTSIDFKGQDFEFIPFGAGRRICAGVTFSVAEAELILANLLYWFNWELPDGATAEGMDMTEAWGQVIHKKTPLLLIPRLASSF